MCMKSVSTYLNFARNANVKKQVNCAGKPLKPSARRMKKNTLNYVFKAV